MGAPLAPIGSFTPTADTGSRSQSYSLPQSWGVVVGGAGTEGARLAFAQPGQAPGARAGGCRGPLYSKALVLPGPSSN